MREILTLACTAGITYFYFPPWEERGEVGHGFSSRCGGVSKGQFASLNMGFKGGDDDAAAVWENRRLFLKLWGKEECDLVYGEQVHGTEIYAIEDDKEKRREINGVCPATDGLVTSKRGVVLGAFSADCLLVYLWDPCAAAIGLIHAGWRGTLGGIVFRGVKLMRDRFAAIPARIQALLAPSIGPCCYEVGSDVICKAGSSPWRYEVVAFPSARKRGHAMLDLRLTNRNILIAAGLLPDNIAISDLCTCCNPKYFYSYRRDGEATGRHMGILFLL